mgnify:CR=1 FL=1
MRILNISIYDTSQFNTKIFEWNDSWKPIVLFHLKNWTGKTTLYTIVRNLLSWKQMNSEKINTSIFWWASIELEHNWMIIKIYNNKSNFFWEINWEAKNENFQDFVMKTIFWNSENYDIIYWWKKTTLSSLLRLSFLSGNDFNSKKSKSIDLFKSQFDWNWKYILFLFCLWVTLDNKFNWNDIFKKTNQIKQLKTTLESIKLEIENNESAQNIKKSKQTLFSEDLKWDGYKACQNNKITIQNLNEIIKKISILISKSQYLQLDTQFIDFLKKEKHNIQIWIQELEENVSSFEKNFDVFSILPKDLLTYEKKEEKIKSLEKSIEEIESTLNNFSDLYDNTFNEYLEIVENMKQNKTYCTNFNINKNLVISRPTWSDWILNGCKFLTNIACQIYAVKYKWKNWMSLFPFWFYDWVFQWADENIILECLSSLISIESKILAHLQIFCFINKYSSENNESLIDKFIYDNTNFVDEISMKPWKKYLIGNI